MNTLKKLLECLFISRGNNFGLLILRAAAGGSMMTHGLAKIRNFAELSQTFFDPVGLGTQLSLVLIIFAEFACSILVIFGVITRLAVIPLIIGMVVAAFFTFPQFSFANSEMAMLYLAVFISLFFMGAGRYSFDQLIGKRVYK